MKILKWASASILLAVAMVILGGEVLEIGKKYELERLVGIPIPGKILYEVTESDVGAMGGVTRIFAKTDRFFELFESCSRNKEFEVSKVDYRHYFVFTDDFDMRGMGRELGCLKEVKSNTRELLVAIDARYIFVFEKQL